MKQEGKIRYAVVGLGYIAQKAVLPAFAHAKNTELVALISSDTEKLTELADQYGVKHTAKYEDFEQCLREAEADAVYIALPNDMHCEYTVRAALAGVHVLCEKPMATSVEECLRMQEACRVAGVQLMVAYRLHFNSANLEAIDMARDSDFGSMRIFSSAFTMQVRDEDNIRLQAKRGGGPLYDLGIYCINAARYIFRAEPIEISAFMASSEDARFSEVEEMVTAVMRFPENRLASFTASFGATDASWYEVIGTRGKLQMEPAFDYSEPLKTTLTTNGRERTFSYPKEDQFAPLLISFSDCILQEKTPEPSAEHGIADLRIIEAIQESARRGAKVLLSIQSPAARPSSDQKQNIPQVRVPGLVNAQEPSEPDTEEKRSA